MLGKIIILAGGKGTRMNSELPKVLFPVAGQPMIERVVSVIEELKIKPVLVVGYKKEEVKDYLKNRADYVWQKEQLGTGHAVGCCQDKLKDYNGPIAVLYGDHPLVSTDTLKSLFARHQGILTMMTTEVEDFTDWREGFYHYGRILRNNDQEVVAIRELKDCNEVEKEVKEVNPGYYCFDSKWLWQNINKLENNNKQNEYYLTDLVEIAVKEGQKINSITIDPVECLGINNQEQLKVIENILK